jgi:Asp-tRNA(Asn)/Glu-tRNA(Gln) amidotransferase A subunit family amidase
MKEAAELDRHIEDTGRVVGPLHGVPISVKVSLFCNWRGYSLTSSGHLACGGSGQYHGLLRLGG